MTQELDHLKLSALYHRTFNSEHGKIVLADLKSLYQGDLLVAGDPYLTHSNLGMSRVIDDIETQIILHEERNNET
jgi:hypothetical protein